MELDETKINVSLDMEDYTMDELIDLCNVLYRLDVYRPARDIENYLIRKRNKPRDEDTQ